MSFATLALDLVFAYLIARKVERAWVRWLAVVLAGLGAILLVVAAAVGLMGITPGQASIMFVTGLIWSPLFVGLFTWGFRRRMKGRQVVVPRDGTSYTQWHGK